MTPEETFDHHLEALMKIIRQLEEDNARYLMIISRVSNELNDPMGSRWCDCPDDDRSLLESLRDHVDLEMGW